jgi:hypothetical protein
VKNRRGATRATIAAVYPILNVSTFLTIATGGLHQGQAPQETPLPYGVLQSPSGYPSLQSMGNPGEEVKFQLRMLTDQPDFADALAAIDAAKDLLDGERPTVANHLVVRLFWQWTQTYADPELVNGVPVWNVVSQWCVWLDQTS